MRRSVFFVGIGGSGMNGIARIMNCQGHLISGSDRDFDRGGRPAFYKSMSESGIKLYQQDGSGVHSNLDMVVTSTAVEQTIPDVKAAIHLGIPIVHRSDALAELLKPYSSIAVAGTSGKSTVTGMCAWVLKKTGFDPTFVNGAPVIQLGYKNQDADSLYGNGNIAVFEADESDGSLVKYKPSIGILTNITQDHMPLADLLDIFGKYIRNIQTALIYNSRCPFATELSKNALEPLSFGTNLKDSFRMTDITLSGITSHCMVEKKKLTVHMPGLHNVENAMAAYSLLRYLGRSPGECVDALASFLGIQRRFQVIGTRSSVTVVDDFAHNPDKIRATMEVARALSSRVLYVFQPHGYGPTRFLFDDLTTQLASGLRRNDHVFVAPIFYAGGTAEKSVSSEDLAARIIALGSSAEATTRDSIPRKAAEIAIKGDWIVIMGARDPSLSLLCREILDALPE